MHGANLKSKAFVTDVWRRTVLFGRFALHWFNYVILLHLVVSASIWDATTLSACLCFYTTEKQNISMFKRLHAANFFSWEMNHMHYIWLSFLHVPLNCSLYTTRQLCCLCAQPVPCQRELSSGHLAARCTITCPVVSTETSVFRMNLFPNII